MAKRTIAETMGGATPTSGVGAGRRYAVGGVPTGTPATLKQWDRLLNAYLPRTAENIAKTTYRMHMVDVGNGQTQAAMDWPGVKNAMDTGEMQIEVLRYDDDGRAVGFRDPGEIQNDIRNAIGPQDVSGAYMTGWDKYMMPKVETAAYARGNAQLQQLFDQESQAAQQGLLGAEDRIVALDETRAEFLESYPNMTERDFSTAMAQPVALELARQGDMEGFNEILDMKYRDSDTPVFTIDERAVMVGKAQSSFQENLAAQLEEMQIGPGAFDNDFNNTPTWVVPYFGPNEQGMGPYSSPDERSWMVGTPDSPDRFAILEGSYAESQMIPGRNRFRHSQYMRIHTPEDLQTYLAQDQINDPASPFYVSPAQKDSIMRRFGEVQEVNVDMANLTQAMGGDQSRVLNQKQVNMQRDALIEFGVLDLGTGAITDGHGAAGLMLNANAMSSEVAGVLMNQFRGDSTTRDQALRAAYTLSQAPMNGAWQDLYDNASPEDQFMLSAIKMHAKNVRLRGDQANWNELGQVVGGYIDNPNVSLAVDSWESTFGDPDARADWNTERQTNLAGRVKDDWQVREYLTDDSDFRIANAPLVQAELAEISEFAYTKGLASGLTADKATEVSDQAVFDHMHNRFDLVEIRHTDQATLIRRGDLPHSHRWNMNRLDQVVEDWSKQDSDFQSLGLGSFNEMNDRGQLVLEPHSQVVGNNMVFGHKITIDGRPVMKDGNMFLLDLSEVKAWANDNRLELEMQQVRDAGSGDARPGRPRRGVTGPGPMGTSGYGF